MSEAAVVVCGFFDQASGLGGLGWRAPGGAGGLLGAEGDAKGATAEIGAEGDGTVELALSAEGARCVARLSPMLELAALTEPGGEATPGSPAAGICRARVEYDGPGGKRAIDCAAHLTRWGEDPLRGAELVRHLAIPVPDGALVVLTSRREPDASGHDAERTGAWLLEAEAQAHAFAEALLSTQYDEAGRQTRAGLELWPAGGEAPPMRAAGTVLGEALVSDSVRAALLESSAEGFASQGSYLIRRS